jgi:acyl carrier protein
MIADELKAVILKVLELEDWDITDQTKASEVPGWDSLNHVNVMLAIEKHFAVRFKNMEIFRLANVGDLQRLLDSKRNTQER